MFKINSIKDVNTGLEKTDEASMNRKDRTYIDVIKSSGRVIFIGDSIATPDTITSKVIKFEINFIKQMTTIITQNSIYEIIRYKGVGN